MSNKISGMTISLPFNVIRSVINSVECCNMIPEAGDSATKVEMQHEFLPYPCIDHMHISIEIKGIYRASSKSGHSYDEMEEIETTLLNLYHQSVSKHGVVEEGYPQEDSYIYNGGKR